MADIRHGRRPERSQRINADLDAFLARIDTMSPEFAGLFLTRPSWPGTISAAATDWAFGTVEHVG
jgi:hypothetical protein